MFNNIERFANIDRNSSSCVTIVDICCPVVYKSDQGSLAAMSDTKSILTGIRVSVYICLKNLPNDDLCAFRIFTI